MNRNFIHILTSSLACCLAVCSCSKEEALIQSDGFDLNLTARVAGMGNSSTRADLLHVPADVTSKKLVLYAWEGSSNWMDGDTVTYSSGKWNVKGGNPVMKRTENYSFLSYVNAPASGASLETPSGKDDSITFKVTDISQAQTDVLLGSETVSNPESGDITIDYSHPYASVAFKLGNAYGVSNVKAISLTGVYASGQTSYSISSETDAKGVVKYTWTDLGKANATLEQTGLDKALGDTIFTFLVIPQVLTSKQAVVTITDKDNNSYAKQLNTNAWVAGYTTTYTLDRYGTVEINVTSAPTISNSGETTLYIRSTITGAWYNSNGDIVAPWSISDGTFTGLPGTDWTTPDNLYYYYSKPLSNSANTKLYTSFTAPSAAPVAGATLKLNILVQAIPYDVNKTCQEAFEAL